MKHTEGVGLKVLGTEVWYGPHAECGVCGTSRPDRLIPQAVLFWDCDDGWRMDVLCESCGEQAAGRGPDPEDYAWDDRHQNRGVMVLADHLEEDMDGVYSSL